MMNVAVGCLLNAMLLCAIVCFVWMLMNAWCCWLTLSCPVIFHAVCLLVLERWFNVDNNTMNIAQKIMCFVLHTVVCLLWEHSHAMLLNNACFEFWLLKMMWPAVMMSCPEMFHACVSLLLCCSCINDFVNRIAVCLTLSESCCLMINIDDEVHDCS